MGHHENFDAFCDTVAALRAPEDGCPWNLAQTHESLAPYLIEEAYETVDAIEKGDARHLCEELGDVLLQVVLQSQVAADAGAFTIDDVCAAVNDKMVRRHPHVFAREQVGSAADVSRLWEQVKKAEREAEEAARAEAGADGGAPEPLLDGVPTGLPALTQAQKISRKAANCGFEWETVDDVWDQVFSEIEELRAVDAEAHPEEATLELGDVLFSLVNVARKLEIDSEDALRATCRKFRNRWSFMEGAAWAAGRSIGDLSMDELQELWDRAKASGR